MHALLKQIFVSAPRALSLFFYPYLQGQKTPSYREMIWLGSEIHISFLRLGDICIKKIGIKILSLLFAINPPLYEAATAAITMQGLSKRGEEVSFLNTGSA
jgi:hypothetical protein